jgi:hypothetical protein
VLRTDLQSSPSTTHAAEQETATDRLPGVGDAMKFFLSVLGMMMILEGLPYFAFPERIKVWLVRISEMPAAQLRVFGFTAMCVGMGLVYLGQHGKIF